jgi:hypothetical protein
MKTPPLPSADAMALRVIAVATDFVGLGEVASNAHWDDARTLWPETDKDVWLRTWMQKVPGWKPGAPYCAAFAGAVVAAVLYSARVSMVQLNNSFLDVWTAHCMTNVRHLQRRGLLSAEPVPGALWLARHGTTDSGHAGIVAAVNGRQMSTIEGNTNDAGGREGDGIFTKLLPIKGRGNLITQGFLHPAGVLELITKL